MPRKAPASPVLPAIAESGHTGMRRPRRSVGAPPKPVRADTFTSNRPAAPAADPRRDLGTAIADAVAGSSAPAGDVDTYAEWMEQAEAATHSPEIDLPNDQPADLAPEPQSRKTEERGVPVSEKGRALARMLEDKQVTIDLPSGQEVIVVADMVARNKVKALQAQMAGIEASVEGPAAEDRDAAEMPAVFTVGELENIISAISGDTREQAAEFISDVIALNRGFEATILPAVEPETESEPTVENNDPECAKCEHFHRSHVNPVDGLGRCDEDMVFPRWEPYPNPKRKAPCSRFKPSMA